MLSLIFDRPRRLPVGMTQFEAFATRIFSKTGMFADELSMRFALSSILIHADAKHGSLPDSYFVDRMIKSAANQVASQVFQDAKVAQAEAAAKLAEAAAQKMEVVADETPAKS